MALSQEEVKKIAHLARLELTEQEVNTFADQLSAILEHAEVLKEVDTEGVEPIAQITDLQNRIFEDEVKGCDVQKQLLEQSPQDVQQNMIKVKSVFDQ